jgi:putative transposon-encoded protein
MMREVQERQKVYDSDFAAVFVQNADFRYDDFGNAAVVDIPDVYAFD